MPKFVFHFTDLFNLGSILTYNCLLSRKTAIMHDILSTDTADATILAHTPPFVKEYVRFYYRPKVPMLFQVEGIKNSQYDDNGYPHCVIPIYLLFDLDVLYSLDTERIIFSDGNLSSRYSQYSNETDFYINNLDFQGIYYPAVTDDPELKRKMQAEFLVKDSVSLDYLHRIYFRTEGELALAKLMYPQIINMPTAVDNNRILFHVNRLFIHSMNITQNDTELFFNISFGNLIDCQCTLLVNLFDEKNEVLCLYNDKLSQMLNKSHSKQSGIFFRKLDVSLINYSFNTIYFQNLQI